MPSPGRVTNQSLSATSTAGTECSDRTFHVLRHLRSARTSRGHTPQSTIPVADDGL